MFTRLGYLIAVLATIFGLLHLGLSYYVASLDNPVERIVATSRYLASGTIDENIEQAIYIILIGLVLGLLAEISLKLTKLKSPKA